MNYTSVVRVTAGLMLTIAAGGLLPALVAAIQSEGQQVFAFLAMSTTISIISSTILLLTNKPTRRARPADGLAVVILFWIGAPIVASLPFILGVANASPLAAIHEAMSCLTTTGHTLIAINTDAWPISLLVWRGVLHIIGAIATITMAASVFAALNLGGPGIHRTVLFTIPEGSFFDAAPRVIIFVAVSMAIALIALTSALVLAGVPGLRAMGDAVSALSTGLVYPDGATRSIVSPAAATILGFGLFLGALGLAIGLPLRRFRLRSLLSAPETVAFCIVVLVFAVIAIVAGGPILGALGWSISAASTSGLPLSDHGLAQTLPITVIVIPALIGGSALSAAGGVKLARLIVLLRRAGQEFRQLGYRKSVVTFRFRERQLSERSVIGVWVYILGYIVAVFACVSGFSFLGQEFDVAIRLAVGGLTNSGAVVDASVSTLQSGESALLTLAMLLGRLEILALLPALVPSFWRG